MDITIKVAGVEPLNIHIEGDPVMALQEYVNIFRRYRKGTLDPPAAQNLINVVSDIRDIISDIEQCLSDVINEAQWTKDELRITFPWTPPPD